MGGGGAYYDRDTKDGYSRGSKGFSQSAETTMSRRSADAALLPYQRVLQTNVKSPVVNAFDVTGSMGDLPKIIYDKMPLIAGQIMENGYLNDPAFSLAAVGDVVSDNAPIQIAEFSPIKKLDGCLERIWLEGNGGGQDVESYEFTAYFYARYCEIPNAVTPFFLFTGDEGFRETLSSNELRQHFGGEHQTIEAAQVFDELKKKFFGNVFLVHRKYQGNDAGIVRQWRNVLGAERVIILPSDQAIADVTLGIFAFMSGERSLDEYLDDMKTKRDVAQTEERIAQVREALLPLTALNVPKKVGVQKKIKGAQAVPLVTPDKKVQKSSAKKDRPNRL